MNDRLTSKPVTFDHPEKLTQGVTVEKDDIIAKTFITEEDGCVKSNIIIENKVTGEIAKKDEVLGEIVVDEVNEDLEEDFDDEEF
jgi:hypothetical protein